MEERGLAQVVPLPEHDVVTVRPVHVQVDLTDVRRELAGQGFHFLQGEGERKNYIIGRGVVLRKMLIPRENFFRWDF